METEEASVPHPMNEVDSIPMDGVVGSIASSLLPSTEHSNLSPRGIPLDPMTATTSAQLAWERSNEVTDASDEHLKYNVAVHESIVKAKPWIKDPHYFKSVKISAVALLKMLMHANSGGIYEVSVMSSYPLNNA